VVTAPDQSSTSFRTSVLLTMLLTAVALAAYIWALFNAQFSLLNALGIAGFCLLLLCPAFVAYQTVRLTLQMGTGVSVRDYVRASIRRVTSLLLIDALVAIPLVVFFSLYLQMALIGLLSDVYLCSTDCPPDAIIQPEIFLLEAITVLIVAVGLWGLNLLASILAAWLALHWQRAAPALSGTIVVLIVTIAVIYTVLGLTGVPQILQDVIVALLPYILTAAAWRWLAERTT